MNIQTNNNVNFGSRIVKTPELVDTAKYAVRTLKSRKAENFLNLLDLIREDENVKKVKITVNSYNNKTLYDIGLKYDKNIFNTVITAYNKEGLYNGIMLIIKEYCKKFAIGRLLKDEPNVAKPLSLKARKYYENKGLYVLLGDRRSPESPTKSSLQKKLKEVFS